MSATGRWQWNVSRDGSTALERLERVVVALTRARAKQIAVAAGVDGLFFGILGACAAVLAVRLGAVHAPLVSAVAVSLALSLGASVVLAWRRRPDDLDVAIRADLRLNLQQRLSTAWELARSGADLRTAEQLATRVVRGQLRARPDHVFPLRIGAWGRLTPVAAILLVLVLVADFDRVSSPSIAVADQAVIGEGARLREFGRRMEARALRDALPRSLEESRRVQSLGSRMESGALARGEALARLRELGAALREQRRSVSGAAGAGVHALEAGAVAGSPLLAGAAQLLARLRNGRMAADDLRRLVVASRSAAGAGIGAERLDRALERFAAGDDEALREVLEILARSERSGRELQEIGRAQDRVDHSQRQLGAGDPGTGVPLAPERPQTAGSGAEDGFDGLAADGLDDGGDGRDGTMPGGGATFGREGSGAGAAAPPPPEAERIGPLVRPESQPRRGPALRATARVLPRPGRPTVEAAQLDPRFAAQIEAVLAKEEVPAHHKAFIRRYFLSLTEAVPGPDPSLEAQSR